MKPGYGIAYLALMLVIPISIAAFAMLSTRRAVLAIMIGSMMFLPSAVNIDAPGIPPLDKQSIPALCILVGVLATARGRIAAARPGRGLDILAIIAVLGVIATIMTNTEVLRFGPKRVQALTSGDLISDITGLVLGPLVPFFLGRTLFRTADDAKDLLRAFSIGALVYMPFILVELKMSPQWHNWIYGYFPSRFAQAIRESGYRPQVFMNHGLVLALFVCTAMLGSWTLVRSRVDIAKFAPRPFAWALTILLALCNSLGALIYGVIMAPLIRYLRPRTQLKIAATIALVALTYPVLRSADLFPADELVELADRYSAERAESLDFRFRHEEALLLRALERPVFGWGGWGRSRVYDEYGRDISVTDGLWVIEFGVGGAVRFVAEFLMMVLPIFMALRKVNELPPADQTLLSGIGLISIVHTIDLLPNAGCGSLYMFLPGVLAGLSQGMSKESARGIDPQMLARVLVLLRRASRARIAQGSLGRPATSR